MNFLNNQTNKFIVLVTGANRGIGFELCRVLALDGSYKVFLSSRNSEDGLLKANILKKENLDVQFLHLDVSSYDSVKNSVATLLNQVNSIDILINNAGIYTDSEDLDEFPSFFDITPKILKSTLDTNLFGPMYLVQELSHHFSNNFLIINVSSGFGKLNTSDDRSGHIAYRSSKASLNAFTRSINHEKIFKNGKIISMCPGWVQSDMGGPNAPKTVVEGAADIFNIIKNQSRLKSGSFIYNFVEQKL